MTAREVTHAGSPTTVGGGTVQVGGIDTGPAGTGEEPAADVGDAEPKTPDTVRL
ncbi:MAG: hypothetical protein ACJ786_14715 [Catenulispora sp.]